METSKSDTKIGPKSFKNVFENNKYFYKWYQKLKIMNYQKMH